MPLLATYTTFCDIAHHLFLPIRLLPCSSHPTRLSASLPTLLSLLGAASGRETDLGRMVLDYMEAGHLGVAETQHGSGLSMPRGTGA